jgi:hypothetical protein
MSTPDKFHLVKNAQDKGGLSLVRAARLDSIDISVSKNSSGYKAEIFAGGERFHGTGGSPVVAMQTLIKEVTQAAIKPMHMGRAPKRVVVAATLLQG